MIRRSIARPADRRLTAGAIPAFLQRAGDRRSARAANSLNEALTVHRLVRTERNTLRRRHPQHHTLVLGASGCASPSTARPEAKRHTELNTTRARRRLRAGSVTVLERT